MPMNFPGGLSPAGASLGLNLPGLGSALGEQVAGETDEERKRRLAELQQSRLLGTSGSAGSAAGTALGLGGSVFGSPFAGIGGTGRIR